MLLMSSTKGPVRDSEGDAASHSTSPVPPASAPSSPFKIGSSFMKQYYHILTTSPEQILKFYKLDASTLSHSLEASTRADPVTLHAETSHSLFYWTKASDIAEKPMPAPGIRFDFGRGAIDAQETINGGILLVVTGVMYLPTAPEVAKPFVHTFVLMNGSPSGQKKKFYVHNDVLRVMSSESHAGVHDDADDVDKTSVVETGETIAESMTAAVSHEPTVSSSTPQLEQDLHDAGVDHLVHSSVTEGESAVEKSMDALDLAKGEDKKKRTKKNSRSRKSDASSPSDKMEDVVEGAVSSSSTPKNGSAKTQSNKANTSSFNTGGKPKSVSSWAGVVASTPAVHKASHPSKGHKATQEEVTEDIKIESELVPSSQPQDPVKPDGTMEKSHVEAAIPVQSNAKVMRNPDATLYIRHVPENTKESEISSLFEPYAIQMKKKILGITLQPVRGFCFVDFDSKEVVDTIMVEVQQLTDEGKHKDASTYKFSVHGQALIVNRKINENTKGRGGSGSGNTNTSGGGAGSGNRPSSNASPTVIQKQSTGDATAATSGGVTAGGGKRRNSPRGGGNRSGGGQRPITPAGGN